MRSPTRREFLKGAAVAVGTLSATVGYAWQLEPRWVTLERRRLPIDGLPAALEGRTLAHLSDLHVGPLVSDGYIRGVLLDVARLKPDIVVVTGDWTTWHPGIVEQAERVYADLPHGRLATIGVLGNHDYGAHWIDTHNAARLADMARAAGCTMLRNEVTEVAGLQVAGMDDLWSSRFDVRRAVRQLDPTRAMLALSHNPDTVDLDGWDPFHGWILSGHTHGGQVKPPFFAPPLLPVRNKRYTSGTFELGNARSLYISRGIGFTLQVRFNARPEVTLFTLERAQERVSATRSAARRTAAT